MAESSPVLSAPRDRSEFHVAIFCALPLEAESVLSVFDVCWEDQDKQYGKAPGDQNAYNTGVIGNHNVVLVHMPGVGGNSAALAAAGLRSTFRGIQLALVVGICGAVPKHPVTKQEIVLGDVIISTAVVQYDFGRQFSGVFERKKAIDDSLGRANPEIRAFTNMLTIQQNHQRFSNKLQQLVQSEGFRTKIPASIHPGTAHDHLYEASYLHRHRSVVTCEKCLTDVETCSRTCEELDCKDNKLVARDRFKLGEGQLASDVSHALLVHVGRFGSANTVMKSGIDRDRLSAADQLTAFEMEGAGVWEQYPTIVIKSACDYADSHKNSNWQKYAAAMAAGSLYIFLKEWIISEPSSDRDDSFETVWHVPFGPLPGFVGREDELCRLEQKLFEPDSARVVALLGLGGMGKSRLALELAFRTRSRRSTHMIFWIQASDQTTFENDLLEIGIKLGIPSIQAKGVDVKALVKQRLSTSEHEWLLILDNADDTMLWGRQSSPNSTQPPLVEYLPRTTNGSVLVTTRSRQVANLLAEREVIELSTLPADEASEMFIEKLQKADLADDRDALSTLLVRLSYLPLALVQAASYINKTQRPVQTYINLMARSEQHTLKLLGQDFGDRSRYPDAINPVATTWLISFEHIRLCYPLAASLLSRMACFHEKGIPQSLLLDDDSEFDDIDFMDAIAVLEGYSFLTKQANTCGSLAVTQEHYDIHRLVQISARNWLKMNNTLTEHRRACTARLLQLFPKQDYEHRSIWTKYLPHAQRLCEESHETDFPGHYALLEKIGRCFVLEGRYGEAIEVLTVVVKWRESLSVFDQWTYEAYNNLSEALIHKDEWCKAEQYIRQAYSWQMECLQKDHPTTRSSIDAIAPGFIDQDNHSQTGQTHLEVAEAKGRVPGLEHPHTLANRSHLAHVRACQGNYFEAEQMFRQLAEVQKRVLGPQHLQTLGSMSYHAGVLRDLGKYTEAEQALRQVLEIQKRVQGLEHPSTLKSLSSIALVLQYQGNYSQAEEMFLQILEVKSRVLGPEHRNTLIDKSNLALVLSRQGKYVEAEEMLHRLIEVEERVLGLENPDTLSSMNNLASVLSHQGKYKEAEQIQLRITKLGTREMGLKHPSTLTKMNNLAAMLGHQGKYAESEQILIPTIKSSIVVLGPQHPNTKTSIDSLRAVWYNQGRETPKIEEMLEDIMKEQSFVILDAEDVKDCGPP